MDRDLIRFSVRAIPPFRLDWTVWTLRRRSMNAVDLWDGETYRRVLAVQGKPALVAVTQRGMMLDVTVTGQGLPPPARQIATRTLERLLGIRIDLSEFYEFSSRHTRLDELAMRFRGLKPPRFATVFEGLVNGITCQQLTLTVGIIFLNRLAKRCGLTFSPGMHAFPRPEDLACLDPADLRPLGYSGSKARALIEVAQSIVAGQLDLDDLTHLENRQCVERLVALRGVGRWTAEYVLLRGLGRIDVFPGDDVGARNNLERWLRLRKKLDYDGVQQVLKEWRGYGGLVFLHLLLKSLDETGDLGRIAALP
ncbi:MAG: DNA-3-methyladenine glycosylase 2 family protein, partial [Acidobacteriota bacterium]|nr:DNA-3-methyladenine glycosylase 2 family protein [Acidobacteriota bacterium]